MKFILFVRAGDPADFLTASTPDLFTKTKGFDFFPQSGSGIFFSAATAPRGKKICVLTVVKFDKVIFFLYKLVRYNCKKYKKVKYIIVFF